MTVSPSYEKTTKLELQAARSDLLDAFAEAEGAVINVLAGHGKQQNKASLGQNIGKIKKDALLQATDGLSEILDNLVALNEVRTEIVHRQMNVIPLQGTTKAIFLERDQGNGIPPTARVISLDQFKAISAQVRKLAKQLNSLLN